MTEQSNTTDYVSPEQQRRNRIKMWRAEILDPARDEDLTPLAPLLDSYAADLIAEAKADRESEGWASYAAEQERLDVVKATIVSVELAERVAAAVMDALPEFRVDAVRNHMAMLVNDAVSNHFHPRDEQRSWDGAGNGE